MSKRGKERDKKERYISEIETITYIIRTNRALCSGYHTAVLCKNEEEDLSALAIAAATSSALHFGNAFGSEIHRSSGQSATPANPSLTQTTRSTKISSISIHRYDIYQIHIYTRMNMVSGSLEETCLMRSRMRVEVTFPSPARRSCITSARRGWTIGASGRGGR